LGEVADIYDTVADSDQIARFNGEPAVMILVYRTAEENVIDVAGAVKAYVAERADLPPGVQLSVWQDDTKELRDRLSTLVENGVAGFLLVLMMLAIFLRPKLALWVSAGLAVAFIGTVALMPSFGMSINSLSLFAFILVLGLLVDDAIVVGENIYRHYEMGSPNAALDGAREIALPVLFSVLTTMVAFTPLSMVPGNAGKFLRILPVIVILALAVSLVESLLILPSHLSHLDRSPKRPSLADRLGFLSLDRLARRVYLPILKTCLRWRYAVLAGSLGSIILTFSLIGGGHLEFSLFPPVESNNLIAFLRMAPGTSAEATGEALAELEAAARRSPRALQAETREDPFQQGLTSIGSQPFRELQRRRSTLAFDATGSHIGEVNLELVDPEERSTSAAELLERWRGESPELPGALDVEFTSELLSAGKAVDVQLASHDFEVLHRASARVRAYLGTQPGVVNIADSAQSGKRRLVFELNDRGRALGLTQAELARQIRRAFFGEDIQRFYRDGREVRVMVRLPEAERADPASLDDMRIRTPGGVSAPLETVADVREDRSRGTVHRVDRERTVNVTADVDLAVTSGNAVNAAMVAQLLDPLVEAEPDLRYRMAGEQEEQAVVFAGLRRNFLLALFTMYALLAIFFRSYTQPLIVMSAIPFGFVGSVWAHFLLGRYFTILSVWGIVAVSGVVVNDSLVLIDRINKVEGNRLPKKLIAAGLMRFRPILLTSITTFAGLTPLLLETSVQAQYLIPMAISVAFGVLFSTSMILVFVPSLYLILRDLGQLRGRIFRHRSAAQPADRPD
ncbi:MAG: efflux RND transporter permease subunit, partial [Acidobacteriota bacterium]